MHANCLWFIVIYVVAGPSLWGKVAEKRSFLHILYFLQPILGSERYPCHLGWNTVREG